MQFWSQRLDRNGDKVRKGMRGLKVVLIEKNWGIKVLNQDSEEKQVEEFKYTVKVINAGNSSGYVIKKWDIMLGSQM